MTAAFAATDRPYQLLPPLDADQRKLLRDSIAASGVLEPVVFDENGEILDGHHRVEIAEELGIEYPRRVVDDLDEDGKQAYALTTNLARRQLTSATRSAHVMRLRQLGMSIRKIAEATGLPKSTVADSLAQVSEPGHLPETITGADNKTYAASRPAPKPANTPEPAEPPSTAPAGSAPAESAAPTAELRDAILALLAGADLGLTVSEIWARASVQAHSSVVRAAVLELAHDDEICVLSGEAARQRWALNQVKPVDDPKPDPAPDPVAAVAAALDEHVPDTDAAKRAWGRDLYARIKPVHDFLLWLKPEDLAAFADEQDLKTLAGLATSFADAHRRAVEAFGSNVTPLRRVK